MHYCITIEVCSIRFPYSDISGSKVAWHLPEAYRRHAASFIAFLKPRHPPYALKHSSPLRKGCLRTAIICCYPAMNCLHSSWGCLLNLHFLPTHFRVHKKTHIGSVRVMECRSTFKKILTVSSCQSPQIFFFELKNPALRGTPCNTRCLLSPPRGFDGH